MTLHLRPLKHAKRAALKLVRDSTHAKLRAELNDNKPSERIVVPLFKIERQPIADKQERRRQPYWQRD
jgi:hypothetical protein